MRDVRLRVPTEVGRECVEVSGDSALRTMMKERARDGADWSLTFFVQDTDPSAPFKLALKI